MLFYIWYNMWVHCHQKACIMLEGAKNLTPPKRQAPPRGTSDAPRSLGHHCRWDSAAAGDVFGIHQWWGANSGGKMSCQFLFGSAFQMKPGWSFWKGIVGWKEKQSEVSFLWIFQNTVCLCLAGKKNTTKYRSITRERWGLGRTTWHGETPTGPHHYTNINIQIIYGIFTIYIYFCSRKPGRTRVIPLQHPI